MIEWPKIISKETLKSVLVCKQKLENHKFKEKVYIKSAYNSILITYEFSIENFYNEILTLKSIFLSLNDTIESSYNLWKIPVCYDEEFGVDLVEISTKNKISIPDIIQTHSNTTYKVYFLGFLPGFLYLGGLDKRLHFSRKRTPRLNVSKGSVAIGGSQTGIYPNESPGGWNIIGKTPLNFFNINSDIPCFAKPGDEIQFVSITKTEYEQIAFSIQNNTYKVESEVIND